MASSPSASAATPSGKSWRPRNKLFSVCIFILVVEMMERLCYYTIVGTMRNFLEDTGPNQADDTRGIGQKAAVSMVATFGMVGYLACFLGGYLADSVLGRYRTILIFSTIYFAGVAVVALSALPAIMSMDASLWIYLFGIFALISLGMGAIKPNVANFGAEQYDVSIEAEAKQQKSFFSWFYLSINVGVVVAFGVMTTLATSGASKESAGNGYFIAYTGAAVAMLLAVVAFVAGTPRYVNTGGVDGTPKLSIICHHLWSGAKGTVKGKVALAGWCLFPVAFLVVLIQAFLYSFPVIASVLNWLAFGLTLLATGLLTTAHLNNDWIEALPTDDTPEGISVEDVKKALKTVPVLLCVNIGFNIGYNSQNTVYPTQACQMNTVLFGGQINGAFVALGDAVAIIIGVPVMENVALPGLKWLRGGRPVTAWARITTGIVLVMLANVSALILEYFRHGMSTGNNPSFVHCPTSLIGSHECSDDGLWLSKCSPHSSLPMTDLSFFWSFIPMMITGIGEILVNPLMYEFAFSESPSNLSSIVQALNLVAAGAISNAITASLSPLVPGDFNTASVQWYFVANVGLTAIFLIAYWLVALVQGPWDASSQDLSKSVDGSEGGTVISAQEVEA